MALTITILGCGSSGGVPRPGSGWGECDPANPLNRRRRCAILIAKAGPRGVTQVLVDAGPDLREQLIDAGVTHLDGVILTHEHADHTHGIDDLRPLVLHMRRTVDIYMDAVTSGMMRDRFRYIFEMLPGSGYPPIAIAHTIAPGHELRIEGEGGPLRILPFHVAHGEIEALALKVDGVVYMPDVSAIPEDAARHLDKLDLWIVDALRIRPHPTHFSLDEALDWISRKTPRHAVLTNLHTDLDHGALAARCPAGVRPAHDGMVLAMERGDVVFR
jgi:phosphoribosyl 1,2-cyclic phosphate phosphodiesterase